MNIVDKLSNSSFSNVQKWKIFKWYCRILYATWIIIDVKWLNKRYFRVHFCHTNSSKLNKNVKVFGRYFFLPKGICSNYIILPYLIWNITSKSNYFDKCVSFLCSNIPAKIYIAMKKTRMNAIESIIQNIRWWFPTSWQFQISNNAFVLYSCTFLISKV